jgi:putative membrane protein
MRAESLFTEQDKETIARTVRAAESETAGEIAVMVVNKSDDYPDGRLTTGLVMGGALSLLAADLLFNASLWYFIGLAIVLIPLCAWLANLLPSLTRLFTPEKRLLDQVSEKALAAFYERGLYKTRDETGVLFFISLFERKVRVLADRGIYQKISPEALQGHASSIARGVRDGVACQSLCQEIERVAVVLAEHFPVKQDDTNELDDEVIIVEN